MWHPEYINVNKMIILRWRLPKKCLWLGECDSMPFVSGQAYSQIVLYGGMQSDATVNILKLSEHLLWCIV